MSVSSPRVELKLCVGFEFVFGSRPCFENFYLCLSVVTSKLLPSCFNEYFKFTSSQFILMQLANHAPW